MARTLSDAVIIAMIEAATRLAGGRGPIAGSTSAAALAQTGEKPPVETTAASPAGGAAASAGDGASPAPATGATGADGAPDGDARTADQIATDFKTIYSQVETLVRVSAEQETPRVGFGPRSS